MVIIIDKASKHFDMNFIKKGKFETEN